MAAMQATASIIKFWQSFAAFVTQKVVTTTVAATSRAFQRRHTRNGRLPRIQMIELRRRTSAPHAADEQTNMELAPLMDSTGSRYDHRWLVSGHWRNQWYPSFNGHRQIWIQPYVKGPEEMPLEPQRRVFSVTR
ncbi:MAG: hypothetical protein KGL39_37805 [Patescibacteria group bacterium]|nr:hypothetical protein [Patescibacteria group bacterium]